MRRRAIAVALPVLCAALMPARALADKDEKKPKGKPPAQRPAPARQAVFPAQAPVLSAGVVTPQGMERMVSDLVQLVGVNGDGEGPVRLDVEGARASSVYEVNYVPASNPTLGVVLGRVTTDSAGRFSGATPEPMPGIAEVGRSGVILLRRVAG